LIQVYDATTGKYPYTYRGHTAAVTTVTWSPDSNYIASAGWDHSVQVWHAV